MTDKEHKRVQDIIFRSSLKILQLDEENRRLKANIAELTAKLKEKLEDKGKK